MVNRGAMKSLLTLAVIVCAAQIAAAIKTRHLKETTLTEGETEHALYDYDGGPGTSNWDGVCANGRIQSPIELKPNTARPVTREAFRFSGAHQTPISTNITNSGHSIKLILKTAQPIRVSGGPFGKNTYEFQQMHFHWGKHLGEGSEHTLSVIRYKTSKPRRTRRFPLEGHAVFYKVGAADPSSDPDGMAVLGVHYEAAPRDNPVLETVTKSVAQIPFPDQYVARSGGPALLDYFPRNLDSYFNYVGSLTTPPCTEGVNWIVFTEKPSVSERQVSQFRKMKDDLGNNVIYNFRETQPLNGRTVNLVKASG